jgi:integrase
MVNLMREEFIMEKILTQQIVMEKTNQENKKYIIKISPKENGYQARTTLNLGGVLKNNPRPECYSINSPKEAITKLVEKMQIILSNYTTKRVKLVGIEEPNIVYYILEETNERPKITFKEPMLVEKENNIKTKSNSINSTEYISNENRIYSVKDVGFIWFNAILDRTKKQPEEDDYLSLKTAESYIYALKKIIIPYFENIENIQDVEEEDINSLLNTLNGKTQKKDILTVLKLFFSFAKKNKYVKYNVTLEIKLPRKRKQLDEIEFIEEEDREKWITCLLNENSNISLLFLSMLLTSARPEEACGYKWSAFDFDNDDVYICNAYKDFCIYNEFMEIIGHERRDDILKTPESYRHIHLDPILKKALKEHKQKQQELFKRLHRKWTENEYVFLNNVNQPYVSDTLSKNMPRFLQRHKKLKLEHITVYGLRHSFATHCKELGMEPEVLAKLMGHTEYETTQKYYIHVSKKRKVDALMRVQEKERNGFKKLKMDDIMELERYNQQSFEDFNNYGIEIDANAKIKSTFLSALA